MQAFSSHGSFSLLGLFRASSLSDRSTIFCIRSSLEGQRLTAATALPSSESSVTGANGETVWSSKVGFQFEYRCDYSVHCRRRALPHSKCQLLLLDLAQKLVQCQQFLGLWLQRRVGFSTRAFKSSLKDAQSSPLRRIFVWNLAMNTFFLHSSSKRFLIAAQIVSNDALSVSERRRITVAARPIRRALTHFLSIALQPLTTATLSKWFSQSLHVWPPSPLKISGIATGLDAISLFSP